MTGLQADKMDPVDEFSVVSFTDFEADARFARGLLDGAISHRAWPQRASDARRVEVYFIDRFSRSGSPRSQANVYFLNQEAVRFCEFLGIELKPEQQIARHSLPHPLGRLVSSWVTDHPSSDLLETMADAVLQGPTSYGIGPPQPDPAPMLDSNPINVRVERGPTPVLWTDTSLLISLGRLDSGESLPEVARVRIVELREAIQAGVRERRFLVVEGEQEDEIGFGHLGAGRALDALARFARGFRFRHRLELEELQFHRTAIAFLSGQTDVWLRLDDAILSDPTTLDSELIVSARFDNNVAEQRDVLDGRQQLAQGLEELRLRQFGRPYEELLNAEYRALEQVEAEIRSSIAEVLRRGQVMAAIEQQRRLPSVSFGRLWREAGGRPSEFWAFCRSAHYRAIPVVDVYAKLYADLLGGGRIESGDAMDLNHVATALPYVDWMLVDSATRNRIRRRGLDSAYGVKVFSMRDADELVALLAATGRHSAS